MELADLYQDVILDHGRNPRHFGELATATNVEEGFNPLCGDRYKIYLQIENEIIKDASFTGQGCAISMAATSLMLEAIIGKPVAAANELFNAYINLLTAKSQVDAVDLGKLEVMQGVTQFPMRIKCATLGWHAMHCACGGEK